MPQQCFCTFIIPLFKIFSSKIIDFRNRLRFLKLTVSLRAYQYALYLNQVRVRIYRFHWLQNNDVLLIYLVGIVV